MVFDRMQRGGGINVNPPNNAIQKQQCSTGGRRPRFVSAAAMEEYRNLKRLRPGLQALILEEMWHIQQKAHRVTPQHPHLPTSSLGMPPGVCNLNSLDPRNNLKAAQDSFPISRPNHGSDSVFSDGTLLTRDNQRAASTIIALGRSMQGIEQVAGVMSTSPGENSSITVCSNRDGVFESEASDRGPINHRNSLQHISPPLENHIRLQTYDNGSFKNNNNGDHMISLSVLEGNTNKVISQKESQRNSVSSDDPLVTLDTPLSTYGGSNSQKQTPVYQQSDISPKKPLLQVDEKLQSQSHLFTVRKDECCNQTAQQDAVKLPQLCEQFHGIQPAASRSIRKRDTFSLKDSNSPFFIKVLLLYMKYKRTSDSQLFLKHMHAKVCRDLQCNCSKYSKLISHFDSCLNSNCRICMPVRRIFANGEVITESKKQKNDLPGTLCSSEINGINTDKIVDILPPLKRQKMENPITNRFAPSVHQHCEVDQLPLLEHQQGSTLHSGDVAEVHKELLSPKEDQTVYNSCKYEIIHELENSDLKDSSLPEDLLVTKTTSGASNTYQELMYDSVPEYTEELTTSPAEKLIEDGSEPDKANLEEKCDAVVSVGDHEANIKSKEHKIQGASLADYFTEGEMKEHLRSFGQRCDQEGRGKHSFGQNICQLCGTDRLEFSPAPIYCSSCGVPIKHNLNYYRGSGETGVPYCFCNSCYRVIRGNIISIHGDHIPKTKLQKEKNNNKNEESWVQCDKCECWQHQICALYNDHQDPGGNAEYICPRCWLEEIETGKRKPLPKPPSFGAKDLPTTMLSDHIEKRLFERLKREREQMAKDSRKQLDEVPGEADLAVRVVLSADKKLKVKQQFLDIFNGDNYPEEFLYRSKAILLFQRIEGVDVCLFAMYVQEYGSECDQPNQRCVYISYLDSIRYLRPDIKTINGEALRTLVYHEILIGYLDYCRKRGFSTCYIWASPPVKGEDYILYCHPENQRIPKVDKLQHWYESMLKKAIRENIVVDLTNFYDYFFLPLGDCITKITAARLPYFDGDYWSTTAESLMGNFEQEGDKGLEKQLTKRTLKAMGHSTSSNDAAKDVLVMQKLGNTISPLKENFFIVHLHFICIRCHQAILSGVRWFCNKCKKINICPRCLVAERNIDGKKTHTSNTGEKHTLSEAVVCDVAPDTEDNDVILDNDLFENRHTFLNFCQGNNYQFDTLRRAKHSSMMILYHLHNSIVNSSSPLGCNMEFSSSTSNKESTH